jgi:hypothetical protein
MFQGDQTMKLIDVIISVVIGMVFISIFVDVFSLGNKKYKAYDIGGDRIITCAHMKRAGTGYIDLTSCTDGKDRLNLEGEVIALK